MYQKQGFIGKRSFLDGKAEIFLILYDNMDFSDVTAEGHRIDGRIEDAHGEGTFTGRMNNKELNFRMRYKDSQGREFAYNLTRKDHNTVEGRFSENGEPLGIVSLDIYSEARLLQILPEMLAQAREIGRTMA